jgi:hypothetical protein
MGVAKKMVTDFMILSIQSSVPLLPAIKRWKYTNTFTLAIFYGYSHRSMHDSGIKRASYSSFKTKLVRSPRQVTSLNCEMPTSSSMRATSHCSVASKSRHVITSWCVENGAWDSFARSFVTKPPEFAAKTVVPSINYLCIRRAGLSIRYRKWCPYCHQQWLWFGTN